MFSALNCAEGSVEIVPFLLRVVPGQDEGCHRRKELRVMKQSLEFGSADRLSGVHMLMNLGQRLSHRRPVPSLSLQFRGHDRHFVGKV